MRGGPWDAGAFAEEVLEVLRAWRRGETTPEEALEAILEAAYDHNFGDVLEEGDEEDA
ncbi:MAG: hypothetical protein ACP5JV_06765 [Thermus sp.]|uniref:hypothetical protein n=1 Tax=Thermus sp. TaxID=275 RepID=UPI003D0DA791